MTHIGVTFEGVAGFSSFFFDGDKVILELILDKFLFVEDMPEVLFGVVIKLGEGAVPW